MKSTLLLICFLIILTEHAASQSISNDSGKPLKIKEYYIASVNVKLTEHKQPPSGGINTAAILQLMQHDVLADHSLRPVAITIKELNLTESTEADQVISGRIELLFTFGLQKDYGIEYLSDYHVVANYKTRGEHSRVINDHIASLVKNGLSFIDNWLKANADTNRKLAKAVKITFKDYKSQIEGDTIYYSSKRPLSWADFQSKHTTNARYEALVMPGIGYNLTAQMVKGTIQVSIEMKTFLPKSASWANSYGRDLYSLNHEQRHFDIVKIISEQFKQKVLAQRLTPDNFEGFINVQYLQAYRDMDALQTLYDKETAHGANKLAQEEWNVRIDKSLQKY